MAGRINLIPVHNRRAGPPSGSGSSAYLGDTDIDILCAYLENTDIDSDTAGEMSVRVAGVVCRALVYQ